MAELVGPYYLFQIIIMQKLLCDILSKVIAGASRGYLVILEWVVGIGVGPHQVAQGPVMWDVFLPAQCVNLRNVFQVRRQPSMAAEGLILNLGEP